MTRRSGRARTRTSADTTLDLTDLPAGYGFQFELRLTDSTKNPSKPILDKVRMSFQP
jgi:hypothetical protein